MRQNHLPTIISLALFFLPNTLALSLANFQEITSSSIPLACQIVYDSQISTCTVSDFTNGCSEACQEALLNTATAVDAACAKVSVSGNTLLGIVKNGGIIGAICPSVETTTTTSSSIIRSTTASVVTIPTSSPGVTIATTRSTTSSRVFSSATVSVKSTATSTTKVNTSTTASVTPQTSSSSKSSSSSSSFSTSTQEQTTAQTTQPATITSSPQTQDSTTKTSSTSTSTSTTKTSSQNSNSNSGGGGGSPFDISSDASSPIFQGSTLVISLLCSILGGGMLVLR